MLDKATGADTIFCPYNRSTRNRFKILYDKVYKFPVQPLITTGGMEPNYTEVLPNRYVQGKVKLNRIVQYSGNSTGIQDIARNAFMCVCISTYDTKENLLMMLILFKLIYVLDLIIKMINK